MPSSLNCNVIDIIELPLCTRIGIELGFTGHKGFRGAPAIRYLIQIKVISDSALIGLPVSTVYLIYITVTVPRMQTLAESRPIVL